MGRLAPHGLGGTTSSTSPLTRLVASPCPAEYAGGALASLLLSLAAEGAAVLIEVEEAFLFVFIFVLDFFFWEPLHDGMGG
jgi:hypothetical protein